MKYLFLLFSFFLYASSVHQFEYESYIKSADLKKCDFKKVSLESRKLPKGLIYSYYGYMPFWTDTSAYSNLQYSLLSHIAYFSVDINSATGALSAIPNMSRFSKIYLEAHPRGVRMHMTYTMFGSSSVSVFLQNHEARINAVKNIMQNVRDYDLDGVNIDFEYSTSSVKDSFTLFLSLLAESLHKSAEGRKELYIAMPAVVSWYPGYNYLALSNLSDGLFIMTYDYHYSGSSNTGPVSPTYNSTFWGYYAVNTSICDYLNAGVSREKMVMGLPYYGYDWPCEGDDPNSVTTGSGSAVVYKNAFENAVSHGYKWDSNSSTPFYSYYQTEWHQCFYDDSSSMFLKLNIASDSLIQGAGCWALGYDDGRSELWSAVSRVFFKHIPINYFNAVVNNSYLNVRSGPSTDYDILSVLYYGEIVTVYDCVENWYRITYPSSYGTVYAWVYGGDGLAVQYLRGITGLYNIEVTASLLNIRSGPSTSYQVIAQAGKEQAFPADSFNSGWAHLQLPDTNKEGWVFYQDYGVVHDSIEYYNDCGFEIDSIDYPDTLLMNERFLLKIFIKNNGSAPADSYINIVGAEESPFYDSGSWLNERRSATGGFNGVKNQKFARNVYMRAPLFSGFVCDTFNLTRQEESVSKKFEVYLFVKDSMAGAEPKTIIRGCVDENFRMNIYDISGREMKNFKSNGVNIDLNSLPSGVYLVRTENVDGVFYRKFINLR